MKRIVQAVCFAAVFAVGQTASAKLLDRIDWSPKVESAFPADAEASYDLQALDSYADRHQNDQRAHAGDAFPVNVAGIVIGD